MERDVEKAQPKGTEPSVDFYRVLSLFSTCCIGLCIFGMVVGFVSHSTQNKTFWFIAFTVFGVSHTLLHFIDKSTRHQLARLPPYLLNTARPYSLLSLYYTGLIIDILTLICALLIAYFFEFPHPIMSTNFFIFVMSSWYSTNELRTYFIKCIDAIPSCCDADCAFHHKISKKFLRRMHSFKTIVLENAQHGKIVYAYDGQTHYHCNAQKQTLTSLEAAKSYNTLYVISYCMWLISLCHEMRLNGFQLTASNQDKFYGLLILLIITIIQTIRILFQVWVLAQQQPIRHAAHAHHEHDQQHVLKSMLPMIASPFVIRIFIVIDVLLCIFMLSYGINNDVKRRDIFTTWAIEHGKSNRSRYLVLAYSLLILLCSVCFVYFLRCFTEFYCGKPSNQTPINHDDHERKEKPRQKVENAENDNHAQLDEKENDNESEQAMDIDTFLTLANKQTFSRNEETVAETRDATLSTLESSDFLVSSDYVQAPEVMTGKHSLDTITSSRSFEINDNFERSILNDHEYTESLLKHGGKHKNYHYDILEHIKRRYQHGSLLQHIWFCLPYDKYFRITCCLLSLVIVGQCLSVSPHILTLPYKNSMLALTMLNVCILARITWSSSFVVCYKYATSHLRAHLLFPKGFLLSYVIGFVVASIVTPMYMALSIYLAKDNEYDDCAYYACYLKLVWLAIWWPVAILMQNENARFLDRYHTFNVEREELESKQASASPVALSNQDENSTPSLSAHEVPHQRSDSVGMLKPYYSWINSIDGCKPLIPILCLLLLLSAETGFIQWEKCVTRNELIFLFTCVLCMFLRAVLLIIAL